MNFNLSNKIILLTGASGFLGKKIAESYSSLGATLILTDINQNKLFSLKNKLLKNNKNIYAFKADLTCEEDIIKLKKFVIKNVKKIDVLYSNAAGKSNSLTSFFKNYESYDYSTWKKIININLDSMFLVTKHFGPLLKKNTNGSSIIFTSSIYGVIAPDRRIYTGSYYKNSKIDSPAVYSASKSAVIGLMKYLASYWGEYKINVNSISPGGFDSGQNNTFKNNYSERVPLRKMADLDDIVGISVFLASDESKYFTGHNFIMDGGLSIW